MLDKSLLDVGDETWRCHIEYIMLQKVEKMCVARGMCGGVLAAVFSAYSESTFAKSRQN